MCHVKQAVRRLNVFSESYVFETVSHKATWLSPVSWSKHFACHPSQPSACSVEGFVVHCKLKIYNLFAGRSASETIYQQAKRLSPSSLSKHCSCPPTPDQVPIIMAYRVWRKPVYVAGRYLKLLRGIAQVR